ncbi:MAG: hypothetical protein J2P21_29530 [Chloracidobacterium sp.]|nr:hypothetical protein [Chloracidobacterium sp.]
MTKHSTVPNTCAIEKMNRMLQVLFKAIAGHASKNRLYISIAVALLLVAVNPRLCVLAQRPFGGNLYKSLFHDVPVSEIKTANWPEDLKRRLDEYKNRSLGFHSQLDDCRALPDDEVPLCEVTRKVEKGIVSLINSRDIEKEATDYARSATLAYEWEGFADGPLDEARYAEDYLGRNPSSVIKPYLILFLAHRYRCAYECLEFEQKFDEQKAISEKYQQYLRMAREYPDRLVKLIAEDLDAEPYLYLETKNHQ